MKLRSFLRYCPECSARYNVFVVAEATFECKGCKRILRWQSLYRARITALLCGLWLPPLMYLFERSDLVFVLGISLGALLYINIIRLVINPSIERTEPVR